VGVMMMDQWRRHPRCFVSSQSNDDDEMMMSTAVSEQTAAKSIVVNLPDCVAGLQAWLCRVYATFNLIYIYYITQCFSFDIFSSCHEDL
jgi:hypothetical protein